MNKPMKRVTIEEARRIATSIGLATLENKIIDIEDNIKSL